MSYAVGQIILDDEYDVFANGLNTVLGVGTGDAGYGQSTIATVAPGTIVSAAQWATLISKNATMGSHQNTTLGAVTSPVTGNIIDYIANLTANKDTVIDASRHNSNANGTTITAGGTSSKTIAWNGAIDTYQKIALGTAAQFRYFWNCGGRVTIEWTRTGGTAETKNTEWSNLLTACGVISITGVGASKTLAAVAYTGTKKTGGSGTPNILLTGTGAFDLTTSQTAIFRQYEATAPYTANYLQLNAYIDPATPTSLFLRTYINDASTDLPVDQNVDGTLTATVKAIQPSTANLTKSWATPVLSTTNAF